MDSAIRGYCSSQDQLVRITIQRNKIHDPRYGANSWSDGHPAGAQAVAFSHCGGQLVIRHNDMYSTTGKYFNDIIGGEDNFTKVGFPNADSDIYGNKLSHAWDDAIEAEGANENVRIWGNYDDFLAWTKSDNFRKAHARAGNERTKPLTVGHPEFEGFHVIQEVTSDGTVKRDAAE